MRTRLLSQNGMLILPSEDEQRVKTAAQQYQQISLRQRHSFKLEETNTLDAEPLVMTKAMTIATNNPNPYLTI